MFPPLSRRHFLCSVAAAMATPPVLAQEESWPSRPIKIIVPSGAGSVTDVLARQLYERLRLALKQTIIIDNRPGASGMLALNAVKNAPADGYTFLHGTASATVMTEALNPNLAVKVQRDLTPVALTAVGGVLLVTHPSVPAKTLPELVELLRREPQKYPSYGSWGVGSNGHLTMEWIKQRTGISINHVPYKTTPSLLTDIVSGLVPIGWLDVVSPLVFIQQGRLNAIAINGEIRNPKLPEVKTMTEQGLPFPATGWHGVFAPKGTPLPILQKMHMEINRLLGQPEIQDSMRRVNVEPAAAISREEFTKRVNNDLASWRKIVIDGNIKPE